MECVGSVMLDPRRFFWNSFSGEEDDVQPDLHQAVERGCRAWDQGKADITVHSHSIHQVVYGEFNLVCSEQKFSPAFVT